MEKLTSRKFWICVAAFLGSIATSIAGICTSNQTVIVIGTVCGILSAAIYAFCEAWVDAKAVDVPANLLNAYNNEADETEGK